MYITVDMLNNAHACAQQVELFCETFPADKYPNGVFVNCTNIKTAVRVELDFDWFIGHMRRIFNLPMSSEIENVIANFNNMQSLLTEYIYDLEELDVPSFKEIYYQRLTDIVCKSMDEIENILYRNQPFDEYYLQVTGFRPTSDGKMQYGNIIVHNEVVYLTDDDNVTQIFLHHVKTRSDLRNLVKLIRGWQYANCI